MAHDTTLIGRHGLLSFATAMFAPAMPWRPAAAQTAGDAAPTQPVQQLDDALLTAMKTGGTTSFQQRKVANLSGGMLR
jgi:hypothetical protein